MGQDRTFWTPMKRDIDQKICKKSASTILVTKSNDRVKEKVLYCSLDLSLLAYYGLNALNIKWKSHTSL